MSRRADHAATITAAAGAPGHASGRATAKRWSS